MPNKPYSTRTIMLLVLLALMPAMITKTIYHGWPMVLTLSIAAITAIFSEALILWLRKKPILSTLNDYSAILTGVLLALSIPAHSPWWLTMNGTLFAIIVVKQCYGGLGFNLFNPAMAGYAMLIIAYPQQMTHWILPFAIMSVDQMSQATALVSFIANPFDQYLAFSYFIGGLLLLKLRIISWHIPITLLLAMSLFSLLLGNLPWFHILHGATLFVAFFIATDPTTSCITRWGKIIFAVSIALIVILIRNYGNYPDAFAFAILVMNSAKPVIDHYSKSKAFAG